MTSPVLLTDSAEQTNALQPLQGGPVVPKPQPAPAIDMDGPVHVQGSARTDTDRRVLQALLGMQDVLQTASLFSSPMFLTSRRVNLAVSESGLVRASPALKCLCSG